MGKILESIKEFSPKLMALIDLANYINTTRLQQELETKVMNVFQALMPLSEEYKIIESYKNGYHKLAIGEWIRLKAQYQTYGSPVTHPASIFEILREEGEQMKAAVRTPIQQDFGSLTSFLSQIVPYSNLIEKTTVEPIENFQLSERGFVFFREDRPTLELQSHYSHSIRIYKDSGSTWQNALSIYIESKNELHLVEDLYTPALVLYKKVKTAVDGKINVNEPILKQMDEVVVPYRFTKMVRRKRVP